MDQLAAFLKLERELSLILDGFIDVYFVRLPLVDLARALVS